VTANGDIEGDIEGLQRHLGGEAAFAYVDFQQQQALSEALQRWEMLRAYCPTVAAARAAERRAQA